MFRPTKSKTRTTLAANEGVKAKRLIGALRALWRSSPTKGHDDKVTELKSYLQASPKRGEHRPAGDEPEEELLPEAAAADDGSVNDGEDGAPRDGQEEHGDSESSQRDSQGSRESGETESEEENDGSEEGGVEEADAEAADTPSTLRAPTMRLDDAREAEESSSESAGDESPVPEDVENKEPFHNDAFEAGDSQVPGSGWMGRAMMNFSGRELAADVLETRDLHYEKLLELIKDSIAYQLGEDIVDGALWENYENWCFDSFMENGDVIFEDVVKGEFFRAWGRKFKSQA